MLRISAPNAPLRPSGKILRADEYAVVAERGQILEEARREAEEIQTRAEVDAESRKQEGYDAGLAEGKVAAAALVAETKLRLVRQLVLAESSLVRVVQRALTQILGEFDSNDLVLRMVRKAIEAEQDQNRVIIRVHPSKVAYLRQRLDEIQAETPGVQWIEIRKDESLSETGCILESEAGTIDASLDHQLAAIGKALNARAAAAAGP
jgi:type III secretion protein L